MYGESIQMKLKQKLILVAAIAILCKVGLRGQSLGLGDRGPSKMFLDARAPDKPPKYSRSEVKRMVRDAKTSEDFERLADYFEYQSMEFQQKELEELSELQRLLALRYHARSYPIQVDHTRELMRGYRSKAQECSARASAYREPLAQFSSLAAPGQVFMTARQTR